MRDRTQMSQQDGFDRQDMHSEQNTQHNPADDNSAMRYGCDIVRYLRNHSAISAAEQSLLRGKRVAVIGLGGLGGFVTECLGRLGVGAMTLIDGDIFEESNLNRQLLATPSKIGCSKAVAASQRLAEINYLVTTYPIHQRLTIENASVLLPGNDVVVDALDNIPDRLVLEQAASRLQLPLVHGAIAGWNGHICTVLPGDNILSYLYEGAQENHSGAEADSGNLSFTAAFVASLQAAEVIKILLGRGELARGKLFQLDLLNNKFEQIELYLPHKK